MNAVPIVEDTETLDVAEWMLRSGVTPDAVVRHLVARFDLSTVEALAVLAGVRARKS